MISHHTANLSARIESIDILRGFTLFGIILVHMVEQYYAGQWPEGVSTTQTIADTVTSGFVGIFIIGKFYMIFSFLFGLSFFIQLSKSGSDKIFLVRFLWRLVILFVIGFIHHLHYRGDILTIYAILGVGLLFFHRLPDKYLVWIAMLLILNVPSMITRGVQLFFPSEQTDLFNQGQEKLLVYYNTVKSGEYIDILKANYTEFVIKMSFQVISGRIYITFGLFLLGIYAGRKRFFENLFEKVLLFKKIIRYALFTILGCVLFSVVFFGGATLLKIQLPDTLNWMIGGFVYDLFNTALASVYVAWILLLVQKEKWQKRLHIFYPVGRMGLTTYLMQTLFGTMVFFSYGLGLVGEIGALISFGVALILFVVQILFARYWFKYFAYGPVEWLWRNLTYLKIYPMRVLREKVDLV